MLSDIVVQHVQMWWTKQSRGGPAAVQRNRVPAAYPLTGEHLAAVHLVVHHESAGFDPRAETRGFTSDGQGKRLRYAEVALDRDGDQLRVSLQPSAFGMPRRHRRPPAARLAAGQWLRWQINYRFVTVNGGEWHYRLDTFNVAFGIKAADLFLGESTRKIDERAILR